VGGSKTKPWTSTKRKIRPSTLREAMVIGEKEKRKRDFLKIY
jgi:hypothetical protein